MYLHIFIYVDDHRPKIFDLSKAINEDVLKSMFHVYKNISKPLNNLDEPMLRW